MERCNSTSLLFPALGLRFWVEAFELVDFWAYVFLGHVGYRHQWYILGSKRVPGDNHNLATAARICNYRDGGPRFGGMTGLHLALAKICCAVTPGRCDVIAMCP